MRDNDAAQEQTETIFDVQRNHHSANDDDDKQEDYEQAETQTKLFTDDRKNEIGMRVREIKHFLAAVAETEPVDAATAERNQGLHLLQAGVFFETLRIEKCREPTHPLRHLRGNQKHAANTR